eukprot:TRINITY_DN3538_c0_g1_i2.p1 TRINITY_DN3538_c0_g1~~TRINITY_DN3538_c0_g1_i2.p1  ORF type:complete len:768 (+),score=176.01 TRINITY_DN3538_c0_g1_i2:60-2363(+)
MEIEGGTREEYAAVSREIAEAQPTSFRAWWITLLAHRNASIEVRVDLFERALNHLPWSYKLWYHFLVETVEALRNECLLSPRFAVADTRFEQALSYLPKMPRLWLLYADFLAARRLITRTRTIYDRALQTLPVSQHEKVWTQYRQWVMSIDSMATTRTVLRRYIKLNPEYKEEYADFLIEKGDFNEAARILVQILNDEGFASPSGRSEYQQFMHLVQIIAENPAQIRDVDGPAVIRQGLSRYTDEVGNLWVQLSGFYVRQGLFDEARNAFEEALESVVTARDFGLVFNAYVKFEEEMLNLLAEADEEATDDRALLGQINEVLGLPPEKVEETVDPREKAVEQGLTRLEKLLERRPLLLSDCLLRQNKDNVKEWLRRLTLVASDTSTLLKTYGEALTQVDPKKADGDFSAIWLSFADFYRRHDDLKNANLILHRASGVIFRRNEEQVLVWQHWVEVLLQCGFVADAFEVLKTALFRRKVDQTDPNHAAVTYVAHSPKLWALYADLERTFGTFETTRAVYRRAVDLKVVTPYMLLNFADFLATAHYYEEAFKAYESGLALFTWPALYDVWLVYLTKFVERHGAEKPERARDLFEKVLAECPADRSAIFYSLYSRFEETHGLLNHSVEVLDRMTSAVPYEEKLEAFNLYIAKVGTFLGITKTRPIFEKAIGALKEKEVIMIGLRYSALERKLGEIDRARGIYVHLSQFTDPSLDLYSLWRTWEEFEVHHGNEDTYREFMRIRRSVQAKYALAPPTLDQIKERIQAEEAKK